MFIRLLKRNNPIRSRSIQDSLVNLVVIGFCASNLLPSRDSVKDTTWGYFDVRCCIRYLSTWPDPRTLTSCNQDFTIDSNSAFIAWTILYLQKIFTPSISTFWMNHLVWSQVIRVLYSLLILHMEHSLPSTSHHLPSQHPFSLPSFQSQHYHCPSSRWPAKIKHETLWKLL